MRVLEARFRLVGATHHVRLLVDGREQVGDRRWELPASTGRKNDPGMFYSLFCPDQHRSLYQDAWHLRLRPEELTANAEIPVAPWSSLYHPDHGCHLLDCGWTVMEVTAPPRAVRLSGEVRVRGPEALVSELRRKLGPRVSEWKGASPLPPDCLVVVGGDRKEKEIMEIQERALRADATMIIWTRARPPASPVLQVLSTEKKTEVSPAWMAQLYVHLMRGASPEDAFARADLHGHEGSQEARRLIGASPSWSPPPQARRIPADWFIRLDRSHQEKLVRECIEGLAPEASSRRIHVVIAVGAQDAALDFFQRRVGTLAPQSLPVVPLQVGWAEHLQAQVDVLARTLGGRSVNDLPRLLGQLRRDQGREATLPFLVVMSHEVATLSRDPTLRGVTIAELKLYIGALERLNRQLLGSRVRMIVVIGVQGAARDHEALQELRQSTETFLVKVLPVLGHVTPDEIESWCESHGLIVDPKELTALASRPYEELVDWLMKRYPTEL